MRNKQKAKIVAMKVDVQTGIASLKAAINAALRTHRVLEYLITHFCVFVSLVILSGYSILNQFKMLPDSITPETIQLSIDFTVILFLLGFSDKVNGEFAKLVKSVDVYNEDKADIHIITSQDELYRMMTTKICAAKKSVCIMHLDQYSPAHYKNEARREYFKFIFDFAAKNENILMRRITSINEREKGEWLKKKMAETESIENLNIAFISSENLDKTYLKTVVSCQIIDDTGVFVLNPLSNTVSGNGDFADCLYIENKKVVALYKKYYDTLWTYAVLGYNDCKVLKCGGEIYPEILDEIMAALDRSKQKIGQTPVSPAPTTHVASSVKAITPYAEMNASASMVTASFLALVSNTETQ
jgi:hypothetical protein